MTPRIMSILVTVGDNWLPPPPDFYDKWIVVAFRAPCPGELYLSIKGEVILADSDMLKGLIDDPVVGRARCILQRKEPAKPEPKYIPFTAEQFAKHKDRWIRLRSDPKWDWIPKHRPVMFRHDEIVIADKKDSYAVTYKELVECYVFEDTGEPCGERVC